MNRSEVVAIVARKTFRDVREVEEILDAVVEVISLSVSVGESVSLPRFGKFQPRDRPPVVLRNRITGEPIYVGPRQSVGFQPAADLKYRLNRNVPKVEKPENPTPFWSDPELVRGDPAGQVEWIHEYMWHGRDERNHYRPLPEQVMKTLDISARQWFSRVNVMLQDGRIKRVDSYSHHRNRHPRTFEVSDPDPWRRWPGQFAASQSARTIRWG